MGKPTVIAYISNDPDSIPERVKLAIAILKDGNSAEHIKKAIEELEDIPALYEFSKHNPFKHYP